jgi:hypothetical protein
MLAITKEAFQECWNRERANISFICFPSMMQNVPFFLADGAQAG